MQREDGKLAVVCGKSRSGKSAWTKQQVAKLEPVVGGRVIVFDIKGEYSAAQGFTVVNKLSELGRLLQASTGPLKVAYCPVNAKKEFGPWAGMALTWCKQSPCIIIAEETAAVTSPNKAPEGWHRVCSQSLGFGAFVFAITQRPSESDKTAFGNASIIHCCKMARDGDRAYMAKELDCPKAMIVDLKADQDTGEFTYIERDIDGETLTEGRLTFD